MEEINRVHEKCAQAQKLFDQVVQSDRQLVNEIRILQNLAAELVKDINGIGALINVGPELPSQQYRR